ALVKRRVIPKPACPVYITLLGRHLVEEANESRRVVAAVPSVLNSKLVSLELVLPADAQEIQVEGETQAVEPILQSIVSADSGGAACKQHSGHLGRLKYDGLDRRLLHQLVAVPGDHVADLVPDHSRQFRFVVGGVQKPAFHKQKAAGESERI